MSICFYNGCPYFVYTSFVAFVVLPIAAVVIMSLYDYFRSPRREKK